ncbi:hypothetical protein D3C80_1850560 [compost metagenome]
MFRSDPDDFFQRCFAADGFKQTIFPQASGCFAMNILNGKFILIFMNSLADGIIDNHAFVYRCPALVTRKMTLCASHGFKNGDRWFR